MTENIKITIEKTISILVKYIIYLAKNTISGKIEKNNNIEYYGKEMQYL
tara:strand:- start:589 stop:735 length:147 start_codon:yes stop_codon:yes gene_type:complete